MCVDWNNKHFTSVVSLVSKSKRHIPIIINGSNKKTYSHDIPGAVILMDIFSYLPDVIILNENETCTY